jgi:hypothetical protein
MYPTIITPIAFIIAKGVRKKLTAVGKTQLVIWRGIR